MGIDPDRCAFVRVKPHRLQRDVEIEIRRWLRVRVSQGHEELDGLTAARVVDEGFELCPRGRHVHLQAQRLDDQMFFTRDRDWVSGGGEGLDGYGSSRLLEERRSAHPRFSKIEKAGSDADHMPIFVLGY